MTSPADHLERARAQVDALTADLDVLMGRDAGAAWIPSGLQAIAALRRAAERLKRPTFRIATFGTTSSGKSTIANALVGRRVAPMDAGELSAGVLHLVDSDVVRLTIEPSESAAWEAGCWEGSDEDIYQRLRSTLKAFQAASHEQNVDPPRARIEGPLLPGRWPSLLDLPVGVQFEVLDLPGLNHAGDQKNLRVLQQQVLGSFCLVALSYAHTDRTARARLLEELRRAVDLLGGETKTMLFVLNRVDNRTDDDDPLEERIEELRTEMARVLGLAEPPELLPLNALALYLAQCVWGTAGIQGEPTTPDDVARRYFDQLMRGSTLDYFFRQGMRDASTKERIETLLRPGTPLSAGDRRWILREVAQWTGGNVLWTRLAERIAENFVQLVIHPAVVEALESTDAALNQFAEICRIRRITNAEKLEEDRRRLGASLESLRTSVTQRSTQLSQRLERAVEHLQAGGPERVNAATAELGQNFLGLRDSISKVKHDLNTTVIGAVCTGLKAGSPVSDIFEHVQPIVGADAARKIRDAIDAGRTEGYGREQAERGWQLRVPLANADSLKPKLRANIDLYVAVREALGRRAAARLQEQSGYFESALQGLIDKELDDIQADAVNLVADAGALAGIFKHARVKVPGFPDVSFAIDDPSLKRTSTSRVEVVERRSCREDVKRTVTDNFVELRMRSAGEMAEEWSKGIDGGEVMLWAQLGAWMQRGVSEQRARYLTVIEEAFTIFDRAYEARLEEIRREGDTRARELESLASHGSSLQEKVGEFKTFTKSYR